jgi:tRNA A37 threonylcarbamoyladenosine biosynthesis protein TsaE
LPDDSSESDRYSPVPYGELDALRFKAELEVAQRELEDISKKAGIAELEWEDQRKQLRQPSTVRLWNRSRIQSGF